jgi:outer membrane PBP1 activator LpoA protein
LENTDSDQRNKPMNMTLKLVSTLLVTGLVVGCASAPPTSQVLSASSSNQQPGEIVIRSVAEGLRLANAASEPTASKILARTARLALERGDLTTSNRLAETLTTDGLSKQEISLLMLTKAQLAFNVGNTEAALRLLTSESFNLLDLNQAMQIEGSLLLADTYLATNRFYASARERVLIHHLLEGSAQKANTNAIFETLLNLPTPILTAYAKKSISNEVRGWLSLSAMSKQFQNRPSQQLRALGNWKKLWIGHPAAENLPDSLTFLDSVVAEQPKVLGILLPQSGPLAAAGNAITKGIMAAHYDANSATEIRVFDSQSITDLLAFIQKEAANGVDLFIGPLEKDKVAALAEARLSVPVLALNRLALPDDARINGNLFQFGLAPEDEAIQIARRAQKDQHRRVLLIAPSDNWGDRSVEAYQSATEGLDTKTIIARYDDDVTYAQFVRQILEVDESQARSDELRRMIGQGFEFTPRRRQDLSMIALLSNGDDARQLSPALAFYYADDLPIFATSQVNDVNATRINNLDLNGVQFLDIPWKLLPKDDLGDRIVNAWPAASGSLGPLFAMGMDSYNLLPRLKQMREFPSTRFYGTTGTLRIEQQILRRDLTWATMEDGSVEVAELSTED